MISEPKYGTDALNMQTTFEIIGDKVKIKGIKHWQGLTGQADYWIVAGRMICNNAMAKHISLCVVPKQLVRHELFKTQGLSIIQYGKNFLDLEVPIENLFEDSLNSNTPLLDILNRSRMQFSGMAIGYLKKILRKTEIQTSRRAIRGKKLKSVPSVQKSISLLQVYYTITKACNQYAAVNSGIEFDLSTETIIANSIKITVTDFMHKASDLNIQLSGGNSFKAGHFGFQGLIDSRPFEIFEGPNDMLINQIGRMSLIGMRKNTITNVQDFINEIVLNNAKSDSSKKLQTSCNYTIDCNKSNIKDYSNIIGRLVTILLNTYFVYNLKSQKFNDYLINNALIYLENRFEIEVFKLNNDLPLHQYQTVIV